MSNIIPVYLIYQYDENKYIINPIWLRKLGAYDVFLSRKNIVVYC